MRQTVLQEPPPVADPNASTIAVRDLVKTYETQDGPVHALAKVGIEVKRGEFVALVGPSGCGKSTILHIVAGLTDYDAGDVKVLGTPAKAGRRETGIMLQKPVLFPWRTVLANVMVPIKVLGLDAAEGEARARQLLETVGLGEFLSKYPWELSGGMRQRASLAQALVGDPQILLMDEPFSAVDEFTRERLNCEVASLHESRDRTTLYVTHNIQEAVFLSDRVVAMKPRPGEIVEVFDIDIPRPRRLEHLAEDHTNHLVTRIRESLARHH